MKTLKVPSPKTEEQETVGHNFLHAMAFRMKGNNMSRRGLWLLPIGLVALVALNSISVPAQKSSGGGKGVAVRQVWTPAVDITGSVSPDGRFLSYTDWGTGNLAVRDLKTGKSHLLTHSGYPEFAFPSTISPDGQQVAYGWTKVDGSSELRLINLDSTRARVIYRTQKSEWIEPRDWSPDGKYIVATLFRQKEGKSQIILVSRADGSARVLKSLDGRSPRKMSFSLDGRTIAYDFPPQEGSANRDIFVLPADGRREVPLVEHPANDLLLDWTPDGRGVLFASDRMGAWGAWVIQVADGKPRGAPQLVQPNIGPISRGLGFAQDGSYYYGLSAWTNDVYLATFDPATGKLQPPKKLISHVGFDTSVAWSPDGQFLAYASGIGRELYSFVLGIRSVEAGQERRFPLRMRRMGRHAFQPRWSPDGGSLLAQGRDHKGRQGLYRINAETGKVTPMVRRDSTIGGSIEWPAWSPDGRVIFTRWTQWPGRNIVVRDLETGREKELYRAASPAGVAHLAVSPDGERLAFIWWDSEKGKAALKVIPASGGEARELVKLPKPVLSSYAQPVAALAWTPDSCHIIYAPTTAGQRRFELWRISAKGGQPQNLELVMEGRLPYGLSVHPDGRRMAFTAGTPVPSEVWVMENFLPALKDGN